MEDLPVLSICISNGRCWKQKGEPYNMCVVRVELGEGDVLAESAKITPDHSTGDAEVELIVKIPVEQNVNMWNRLANTPLLISLNQTQNSPKKGKKIQTPITQVGIFCVDLLPFLYEQPSSDEVKTFFFSPVDKLLTDSEKFMLKNRPEIDLAFATSAPLIPNDILAESNLVVYKLEAYYGISDKMKEIWESAEISTGIFIPGETIDDDMQVMVHGAVAAHDAHHGIHQRYWPGRTGKKSESDFIPNKGLTASMAKNGVDVEGKADDDDLRGDQVERDEMSDDAPRFVLSTERRFFLTKAYIDSFEQYISRYKILPIELYIRFDKPNRSHSIVGSKARRRTLDEIVVVHNGMILPDLSSLMYPGLNRHRGAHRVHPLDIDEFEVISGGRRSIFTNMGATFHFDGSRPSSSSQIGRVHTARLPVAEEKEKADKKGDKKMRSTPSRFPPEIVSHKPSEETTEISKDAFFEDGILFLVFDVELKHALVQKRTQDDLLIGIKDLIPQRPPLPEEASSAFAVEKRYKKRIRELCQNLITEVREAKKNYCNGEEPVDLETFWQKFSFDLNTSGKYFAIKELLKPSIIEIVREKYLKNTSFRTQEQVEDFLSQLYIYLVTDMHAALNVYLDSEEYPTRLDRQVSCDALKEFAIEAEHLGRWKKSQEFYLERIAHDRNNPDYWIEYAVFCMGVSNLDAAEECLKEVSNIDQRHPLGLLLTGILASMRQNYKLAPICFELAITERQECFITQTIYGMHLERSDDHIGAEIAYHSALNQFIRAEEQNTVEHLLQYKKADYLGLECCPVPPLEETHISHIHEDDKEEELDEEEELEEEEEDEEHDERDDRGEQEEDDEEATAIVTQTDIPQRKPTASSIEATEQQSQHHQEQEQNKTSEPTLSNTKSGLLQAQSSGSKIKADKKKNKKAKSHLSVNKDKRRSRSASTTVKKHHHHHEETVETPPPVVEVETESKESIRKRMFLTVAQFLMKHRALSFADHAVSKMLVNNKEDQLSVEYYCTAGKLNYLMGDLLTAFEICQTALKYYYREPRLWSLMGHICYWNHDYQQAREYYETLLQVGGELADMHDVYLFLGEIYYHEKKYRLARDQFLKAIQGRSAPFSWLWLGKSCFRLGHYGDAEEALSEANLLDNINGETWLYLSLLSLLSDRKVAAEQCYKYAVKIGGFPEDLLEEVHNLQKEKGFGDPGFLSHWWCRQYEETK